MKNIVKLLCLVLFLSAGGLVLSSFGDKNKMAVKNLQFSYRKAGLTERQAAAHLLSRFTFGATPDQVDEVVKMGLEKWFMQQLQADLPDNSLNQKLAGYETLKMTSQQIVQTYPKGGQLKKMAIKDGFIDRNAIEKDAVDKTARKAYSEKLMAYRQQKGFRPQREVVQDLINQKILRSAYSENQLQELLTSFWFNHFNVSLTDNDCSHFITAYERDAIRPNVLGKFETILLATAKSPAMLTYLDNFKNSVANESVPASQKLRQQRQIRRLEQHQVTDTTIQEMQVAQKVKKAKKVQGLNENYAREIMELHTLGVDGGYTQSDVTQAAGVLTGWTIYPMGRMDNPQVRKMVGRANSAAFSKRGFVRDGDFLFAANKHDKRGKVVMGTTFPANGGYEEGVKLIKMLAHHPATAKFISTKLAVRFVSDAPPQSLVDKMAKAFVETDGDIRRVLVVMASSPEFWGKESLREKIKSPFELAISSVRSLHADVQDPGQLYKWITKMGENMYYYQAPTGFPDKGKYWINTGSLLNRMNFGLALASQRIPGIKINLATLNQNREPESAEAALVIYSKYLMPERDLDETIKRLTPSLNDPGFGRKVDAAASKTATLIEPDDVLMQESDRMTNANGKEMRLKEQSGKKNPGKNRSTAMELQWGEGHNTMLAQVVGVIIGSPEFQRR